MNRIRLCWFICLIVLLNQDVNGQSICWDSTCAESIGEIKKINISGFLATSFFINSNWKDANNSCILFSGSLNVNYIRSFSEKKKIMEFRSELSYLKFIDSIWIKNGDNVFLSSIWRFDGRKNIRSSFSISLKTQLTNSWETENSGAVYRRKWKSGPLLPLTFITGYGLNIILPNESYLNISLASVKINSLPRMNQVLSETKILARTDKIILQSQMGANIQGTLKFYLLKNILWENKTSFFISMPDKKIIDFDIQNSLAIRLRQYLSLKFENKLVYNFPASDKLQIRHELLLGFSFLKK